MSENGSCDVPFYIYFVYKNMAKTAFYSKDSNVALAGILLVVSGIMIAMRSSLIVSLGMVGALSIVRFNSNKKSTRLVLLLLVNK